MTVLQEVLTPARFRAWLEEQEAGARVGWSDSPEQCPLACYVSTQYDHAYVRVCRTDMQVGGAVNLLPEWAWEFVERIDGPLDPVRLGRPVTREEALRLLEGVAA